MRRVLASLLALTIALGAPALAGAVTLAGLDESSSGHDWSTNLFFSRMEERTGVPIELNQYKTASEWTAAKAAMLSGDPSSLPEVLFKAALTEQETLGLYQSGVLIDLKPYLAENAPNLCALFQKHPDWEQAVTLPGGAIAALPLINELPTNNAVWINQTWLEALGLSMPETAEEFSSMLKAFKTGDPNRNGRADEVPLTYTGIWDLRWLSHAFGFVSDDYYLYLDDTGIVHSVLPTEQNKAFLSWLNGLWNEGLLDRNGLVTSSTSRAITDSNAEIRFGAIIGPTPLTMVPASALNDYDLMFPLVSDSGKIFRSFPGPLTRGTFALTSACSDPAAMLRWVDYLYGSEGSRFL